MWTAKMKILSSLAIVLPVMVVGWMILIFSFISMYSFPDHIYTYDSGNQPRLSQLMMQIAVPKKIPKYIKCCGYSNGAVIVGDARPVSTQLVVSSIR
jgi:hypothetical protein